MKVLHISAANSSAGAGIACVRLHEGLLNLNIRSEILFLTKDTKSLSNVIYYERSWQRKAKRLLYSFLDRLFLQLYRKRKKNELFSPGFLGIELKNHQSFRSADIIHLHWINHAFIDVRDLKKINKPIIWTMHDCWAFTGGCHYFLNCSGFKTSCGSCPALGSESTFDLSRLMMERKIEVYKNMANIHFVAISSWMRNNAKVSALMKDRKIETIYSGIDVNYYKYFDRRVARIEFGFEAEEKVILTGAQHLNSPYKGVSLSVAALNKYRGGPITVITFGGGGLILNNPLVKVRNLGFINDQRKMAMLYALSDVFLCTSIAEGFGMTVAEAQCCGVPALAFEKTGPSDIILHRKTGYLAKFEDVDDIMFGLEFCLGYSFERSEISKSAMERFSIHNCAVQYQDLYKNVLSEE